MVSGGWLVGCEICKCPPHKTASHLYLTPFYSSLLPKVPDGKPQNQFALEERFMNAAYAMDVIYETHAAWAALMKGAAYSPLAPNTTLHVPLPVYTCPRP